MSGLNQVEMSGSRYVAGHVGARPDHEQTPVRARSDGELAKLRAKGKAPADDRWKAKYQEPEPVDESGLPELPQKWCWTTAEALAHRSINYGIRLAPIIRVECRTFVSPR